MAQASGIERVYRGYVMLLRRLVVLLGIGAGAAVAAMVVLTSVDVVGRYFGHPVRGTYEIIELLGAVTIMGALPYTKAIKGHVAVEFLYLRLPRLGKVILDTLMRLVVLGLFVFLTWRFVLYGRDLHASGEVTATLHWPIFWVPYWMAGCSAAVVLVTLYHLVHPGRRLMQP